MVRRIGVEVTSSVRSGPSNTGTPSGIYQIAGFTERGPIDRAVRVRTFGQFQAFLGGRTPYSGAAYDAARSFFEIGGADLLVSRVVGPEAENASVTLTAGEDDEETDVLRFRVAEPGGFANSWKVVVSRQGGFNSTYSVAIMDGNDEPIADWRGLRTYGDVAQRAGRFDALNVSLIADADDDINFNEGEFDFEDGDDDRSNAGTSAHIAALQNAGSEAQGGAVAIPGFPADVVGAELAEHAAAHHQIAILAPSADASVNDVEALAADLRDSGRGEYAGLFYPYLNIPDGSSSRQVSPESAVAGLRARAFATGEFWNRPAGVSRGRMNWVTSTVVPVNQDLLDRLDVAQVNGIETRGSRIYLNNWASLAADREDWPFISDRDVLNNLKVQFEEVLQPMVWENIDGNGFLLSDVESALTAVLAPIADANGFYAMLDEEGELVDPGYLVVVDTTNNTLQSAAANQVIADVSVRLAPAAKLIQVETVKVAIGAAL